MRIHNNPLAGLQKIYEQQKKAPADPNFKTGAKDDGIELSTEARFYSVACKALNDLPDPKPENLDQLKEAVKTGSYHVQNEDIAEKILQESLIDKLV